MVELLLALVQPVLGDVLASAASIFGIVLGVIGVGTVGVGLGRKYVKRKEGPAAERSLLHKVNTALVGEGDPTPFNPYPDPGLIADVAALKKGQSDLKEQFEKFVTSTMPNGGDTDNVGDVLLRQGRSLGKIMDHLGIES